MKKIILATPSIMPKDFINIPMEKIDLAKFEVHERPGAYGRKSKQRNQELREKYGEDYLLGYYWDKVVITRDSALQIYEDAYLEFLKKNQTLLNWLIDNAADVYDTNPNNINSGINYNMQEENKATHLQDIAIRRCLIRLKKWFKGNHLIQIRSANSEGANFSPGIILFHKPEMIYKPEIKGWWKSNSIESFWQSNKVIITKK